MLLYFFSAQRAKSKLQCFSLIFEFNSVLLPILSIRGWVVESNICEFNPDSMLNPKIFEKRKCQRDKDYRAAVIEAVRVMVAVGKTFPQSTFDLLSNLQVSTVQVLKEGD